MAGLRDPLPRKLVVDHLQSHGWWTPMRAARQLVTGSHLTPVLCVPGLAGRVTERAAGRWCCDYCRHSLVVSGNDSSEAPAADPIRTLLHVLAILCCLGLFSDAW